ncbi:MAG: aldehyde dehydrogenase EutE, partial [Ignavibacteriae bacterium HGW-Ignavibacteriae-2]
MELNASDIAKIVESVVRKMNENPQSRYTGRYPLGIFETLDEAVEEAHRAQKKIRNLELRKNIIDALRKAAVEHSRELAELAVQETGMGRIEDKYNKNILQAYATPGIEVLDPQAVSGDHGLTLIENAPWGVIASVTPSTN